jgi:hypothetical protein
VPKYSKTTGAPHKTHTGRGECIQIFENSRTWEQEGMRGGGFRGSRHTSGTRVALFETNGATGHVISKMSKLAVAVALLLIGSVMADDACWKRAYGRGAGKAISICDAGTERDGALCYPLCSSGFTGIGPVCWENCPSGFKNTGVDCLKPSSYGRGAGYLPRDLGTCEAHHSQGCEKYGLLYYPKCAANYHAVGCCVCSPDCPSDMRDIGVSCQKRSYGRTAGTPFKCAAGLEEDAGLCYKPCSSEPWNWPCLLGSLPKWMA